jgi:mRNA-degrading endonuclease RelE of RelBE toxin-antitoxin system
MTLKVFQSPLFERQKKHLNPNEIGALDDVIKKLSDNPEIGKEKKGDLAGVCVYKFKIKAKLLLLAYEFNNLELLLISIGSHQHFYRDLKRYTKA